MKPLKVLVGCEYSGVVRDAFIKRGHNAMSCDLLPTDVSGPHYQGDVFDVLDDDWDLGIFHPPCTYLTNAGVRWLHEHVQSRRGNKPTVSGHTRWDAMREGALFFRRLLNCNIPKVAVENPIMHKYAIAEIGQKHTQLIQPWMFGHPERKATCLWLRDLPPLVPTNNVKAYMLTLPRAQQNRLYYLGPSKDRWKLRSTTFQGIADAMAEQWG